MKADIHPDYHEITVKMTDGTTFKTRSTYGKKGDVLQLDVDPKTHNAWTGAGTMLNEKAGKVAKFNSKFGGISFGKKPANAAETSEETKEDEAK